MSKFEIIENERKRSRRYPGASLKFCIKMASDVHRVCGNGTLSKEELAEIVAEGGAIGTVNRRIGALAQFGLTARDEDGISLTPLASRILSGENLGESLREAFVKPELYVQILSELGRVPIPSIIRLAEILDDEAFGILPSKVEHAAKIFWESAQFANLLDVVPADLLAESAEPQKVSPLMSETSLPVPESGRRSLFLSSPPVDVVLPTQLSEPEKERLREWLVEVVIPAIKFLD